MDKTTQIIKNKISCVQVMDFHYYRILAIACRANNNVCIDPISKQQ